MAFLSGKRTNTFRLQCTYAHVIAVLTFNIYFLSYRFLLIFDISRNVNSILNAVISVNTVLECTCYIPTFKLDMTEYNASYLSVIALLLFKLYWIKEEYFEFLGGPPGIYIYIYIYIFVCSFHAVSSSVITVHTYGKMLSIR